MPRRLRLEALEQRQVLAAAPIISEFMADNTQTLADGDGNYSDWIEIFNAGDTGIDLAGWHLTDDAAELGKWTFPSTQLDPGNFFVVFASAPDDGVGGVLDNYVDGAGNLHTNFRLNAGGEYLALVRPDMTVAGQFSPAFPEQFPDVAYGGGQTTAFTELVPSGSDGKLLIPDQATGPAIGIAWTGGAEPFPDATWQDVALGVGFDQVTGPTELANVALGKSVSQSSSGFGFDGSLAVDGQRAGNSISHTATGDLSPWLEIDLSEEFLIERIDVFTRDNCCTSGGSPERDYNLTVEVVDAVDAIVFTSTVFNAWDGAGTSATDVGQGTSFTVDLAGEGGGGVTGTKVRISKQALGGEDHSEWLHLAEVEVFAQSGMGTEEENLALNRPTTGDVAFGFPTSNGVDGSPGNFTHSGNVGPVFWQVDLESPTDLGRIELFNRAGCCPERLNGAVLSVLDENMSPIFTADAFANAGDGQMFAFDNGRAGFRDARYIRVEHNNQYLSIAEVRALSPAGYDVFIETDVEAAMKDKGASAYVRVPFTIADAAAFDQLTLGMNYDDGFVAYLNGTEIARRNAPAGTPNYDASAAAENPGGVREEFNLPAALLRTGQNVLAIHGLNVSADDGDFLLSPTLSARQLSQSSSGYLVNPTPGAPNNNVVLGFVADTSFDADRGFYDAPFDVQITTNTPGATVIYTIDGSAPNQRNGQRVQAPDPLSPPVATVHVDTTTTLRAMAILDGFVPTNVDTQTYIFLSDVLTQPANPPGLPSTWDGISQAPINADYEVDPEVVNNPAYSDEIIDGLKSIPTISIVMDPADLFGSQRGIYINSGQRGSAWERPTSVEIIEPGGSSFQTDSGIRIHGFSWRFHSNTPKHSFRLEFSDEYGPRKLEYPLFPDSPVDKFDSIVLRAQGGRAWAGFQNPSEAQYLRDTFARDLAREMGAVDGHATLVHLYLNGLYWGVYNPVERPDAQMGEEYFGGSDEDYDALNRRTSTNEAIDGDLVRYNEMIALANSALASRRTSDQVYEEFQRLVAMDDFIDWFIRNQFVTNRDGLSAFDGNNQRAIGSRVGDPQFRFFVWDMEYSMWNATDNNNIAPGLNSPALAGSQSPQAHAWTVYNALRQNAEFRLRFADHVHKHLFNHGALTPAAAAATWEARAESIYTAIIGESARWGDAKRSTPYTRDVEWQAERNRLLTQYFPQRTGVLLNQYIDVGLYPDVPAPEYLVNGSRQHGGQVAFGDLLSLFATEDIYYTLDGSDPRLPGGMINPAAIAASAGATTTLLEAGQPSRVFIPTDGSLGTSWRDVGFDDAGWISGATGVGYDAGAIPSYDPLIGADVESQMLGVNSTAYVRVPFQVGDPASFDRLLLKMKYDDGFVAYLNGVKVASVNDPENLAWNSDAEDNHEASVTVFETFDITAFLSALRPGDNVLAIHGLNFGAASSDFLILPELDAVEFVDNSIVLDTSTTVKARALVDGQWSALSDARFFVNQPADAANLALTEINYHPHGPTAAEWAIDPTLTGGDFEFVELQNTSAATINLTDVAFTEGVAFTFPGGIGAELAPGQHVLVVQNLAAFEARYGAGHNVAGVFTSGALSNGGETIEIVDRFGGLIAQFTYNDSGAWPGRADGNGSSLEIVNAAGDYNDGNNWRASTEYGGSPGTAGLGEFADVIVNEVLTRTDNGALDAIELHNPTAADVNIGGWYLSDTNENYFKFAIGADMTIPAGGYRVFDESDFNPTPGVGDSFALDGAHGDDVWLLAADGATGRPLRFADRVEFGATEIGVSLGRWPNGSGDLFPMTEFTPGAANSGPRFGPVIISEVMYNPTDMPGDEDLEFIELFNSDGATLGMGGWRLDGAVQMELPAGTMLQSGGVLVAVHFDPGNAVAAAAFRTHYGIDDSVILVGPYTGVLNNAGERLQLLRPDIPSPTEPLFIPHVVIDEVRYDDAGPWPAGADGAGDSLTRAAADVFGNLAGSWTGLSPTPGGVSFTPSQPGDTDGDGDVDIDDLNAVRNNFGGSGPGDANGDGVVNIDDLNAVRNNFGAAPPAAVSEIPNRGRFRIAPKVQPVRHDERLWRSSRGHAIPAAADLMIRGVALDEFIEELSGTFLQSRWRSV